VSQSGGATDGIGFFAPIVLVPHDPAMIRGGVRDFTQHIIAPGHLNISTHSGGQHLSASA
jgi:hypothetical protein